MKYRYNRNWVQGTLAANCFITTIANLLNSLQVIPASLP